jgi:hypothetical protein
MKRTQIAIAAAALILSLSTASYAGTITGSRTNRVGTITGSRTGTITGSATGTITGSRTGTITGSATGTIPGSSKEEGEIVLQDNIVTKLTSIVINLIW